MKWLSLPLIVLLITVINCGSTKKQDSLTHNHEITSVVLTNTVLPITFVKEKETKVEEIGNIKFQNICSDRYILVKAERSANTNFCFLKYDNDLQLIQKMVITYGQGPLECAYPAIMGGDENNIIVDDIPVMRYYLYDKDMRTRQNITAVPKGWVPHGPKYSHKHQTYLSCAYNTDDNYNDSYNYFIYLRELKNNILKDRIIYEIPRRFYLGNGLYLVSMPFHFNMINDCIYILKKEEYRILKINLSGKILKEVLIKGLPNKEFSRHDRDQWIKESKMKGLNPKQATYPEKLWHANWIMGLGDGIAVGRMEDYNPDTNPEWGDADYYDLDLNYLGKIKMPWYEGWNEPGLYCNDFNNYSKGNMLFVIDRRDNADDEEYWITRWRIVKQ